MSRATSVAAPFAAFATFGTFWGVWGASIPQIQVRAGVSDGELGVALLFVGAGALPAMLVTGRLLDHLGLRVGGLLLPALGGAGLLVALGGDGLPELCLGLAVVGVASGASDVAINAMGGAVEHRVGGPVVAHSHGFFSAAVVVGSLGAGAAFGALDQPLWVPFGCTAVLLTGVGWALTRRLPGGASRQGDGRGRTPGPEVRAGALPLTALLLLGVLGALAFAAENAHQSWSAVFATSELHAGPGTAALAPAVFAGTVAVARFSAGALVDRHPAGVLVGGAALATVGTSVVAGAPDLVVASTGLALAAIGTGVLFPTLMSVMARATPDAQRGRATSVVTAIAYLGFLLGPVYVGAWSEAAGLRGAMVSVAMLTVVLVIGAPGLLRVAHRSLAGGAFAGARGGRS